MSITHENNSKITPPHICNIAVEGYKSFSEKRSMDVRKLTILTGLNSSGKSSILQPLLLMKQTLEESYDPGPFLLNGPHVKFNKLSQIFSRASKSNRFGVKISLSSGSSSELIYKKDKDSLIIEKAVYNSGSKEVKFHSKMSEKAIFRQDSDLKTLKSIFSHQFGKSVKDSPSDKGDPKGEATIKIFRDRCFLNVGVFLASEPENRPIQFTNVPEIREKILSTIHVPALRGNPKRLYPKTAIESRYPGTFEHYVASIITQWMETQNPKLNDLNSALRDLGLTNEVRTTRIDDTSVELEVPLLPIKSLETNKDWINIVDVGFGISQTLPVLVSLLVAKEGQLVYLEQPEIHLHPKAQFDLARILVKAAKRGVNVVVETHSDLLLIGIQTAIAKGDLSSEDAVFHWFERDNFGVTNISSTTLNKDGTYAQEFPIDFDRVYLKAQSDYLDASASHIFENDGSEVQE
ncbi:MAG: AAA family ATPase [Methanoculleus marisnigri]|nr:AAA family ATPase [Methanoculleus marisnigri]